MNKKANKPVPAEMRYYFVDEGGDGTIFANRGKVIIGTPGCSRFFMLGLLDVVDPAALDIVFKELRARLMVDPYFNGVPSMRADGRKTALAFHAKDDIPEVRKEVFELLRKMDGLRFFAAVTDKKSVLEFVRQQNERSSIYHYQPNELYDYLVRRLFKDRLHQDGGYEIMFSKRGQSDRTSALKYALDAARQRFAKQWGISSNAPMQVSAGIPLEHAGLQAVDYFTWALQRLYEMKEDRYVSYLWPSFHLVQDLDDKRKAGYGVYYTQKKPLTAASLAWRK
jgi:hypothetical protein